MKYLTQNLEGVILGTIFLIVYALIVFLFLENSRTKRVAKWMFLVGLGLFWLGTIIDYTSLVIIGHNLTLLSLIVGIYGNYLQRNELLIVFISSYVSLQMVGYIFSIESLQTVIITESSRSFIPVGPAMILSCIVVLTYYFFLNKVKKIDVN